MTKKNKIIITIFLPALLLLFQSSCANYLQDLASREKELKARQNYNGYLALEYLEYSRDLANKYDWRDSDYFARKGIKAARNQEVFPEVPEEWDLDNSQIEQATLAREKLIKMTYNPKARQILQPHLAHLQLLYDCWISREKEPWQLADMAKCKILFFRLEDEMTKYLEKKEPKKEIKTIEIKEPELIRFDIYFDLDLYNFNSKADKTFYDLFKYLETLNGNYKIMVVGSADRLGNKLYNDALARKRALAVKTRLVKNGIPEDLVLMKSFGEERPEIITKEDDQNRNNRYVRIYVLKGSDDLSVIPLPLIDNYLYKKEMIKIKKQRGI
ncbi:MAG: cell envelope biosis protein OmpA [Rickettsiaceae bacterium]|jgi:outer membrane protein OmpA-like peptidoglycan-associated protein|nr:cell envelope biosis protein OmpA [Rickettsiaceae bacterium]